MPAIRVILADDHPVVRQGIRNMLEATIGIDVIAEAETGAETIQLVRQLDPDVLLLDIEMPDLRGVEVIKRLDEEGLQVKVLVLSSYDDNAFISEILSHGASGYLMKDEDSKQIVEAVRGVARGEKGWLSRKVASKLSRIMEEEQVGGKDLTPRELQVLSKVVAGKTNAEIGQLLGISEKTVEKHLDKVFKKLDVASRVEAAVLAVREGMLPDPGSK
jgi:DNA-binding NarL/FixJ family response regulator